MLEIKIDFSLEWLNENSEKAGNISRKIMKEAIKTEGVKPIAVQRAAITLSVPNDKEKDVKKIILDYITKEFGNNAPDDMQLSIAVNDNNSDIQSESGEAESEGSNPKETESKEAASEEKFSKKAGKKESSQKTTSKESTSEKSVSKESAKAKSCSNKDENQNKLDIEELINKVPIKYAPDLKEYIKEIVKIIPAVKELDIQGSLWDEALLIGVEYGYRVDEFATALNTILVNGLDGSEESGKTFTTKKVKSVKETTLVEDAESKGSPIIPASNGYRVVMIDISECTSQLSKDEAKATLRTIRKKCKDSIVIFCVPLVEPYIMQEYRDNLNDVMNTRTLIVPSLSMVSMVEYVSDLLKSKGLSVTEGAQERIENMIMDEKSDDCFYGYDSLDKISNKIMYEKAYLMVSSNNSTKEVDVDTFDRIAGKIIEEADPYEALNALVGITEVKERVREVVTQIKVGKTLADQGKNVERPSIHMMFLGNPGTGKTTVARIVAKILKDEGVLRRGHFFEIKARDLVGKYVGHTTPKTVAICKDAYGSVLFIDEAYTLCTGGERDYGSEAAAALMSEMENHRDDMCVIFAGYEEDMKALYALNAGFESRIPYKIAFPNYTKDELTEIFFKIVDGRFEYEDTFKETVQEFINQLPEEKLEEKSFSNGRFIRNLYERVWGKAALRMSIENSDSVILKSEDFDLAIKDTEFDKAFTTTKKTFGFNI